MSIISNSGDANGDSKQDWEEEQEDSEELARFLDFLWEDIIKNPDKLEPYTEEMHARAMELTEAVELDDEDWDV